MSIPHYGVLKARPIDRRLGAGQTPHYQIRAVAGGEHYRIAINVKSRKSPSERSTLLMSDSSTRLQIFSRI